MEAIGGYFGLEINQLQEHYPDVIRLNTGRNALEYLLITNNYTKIFIPHFTCDVLLQPIIKLKIDYEFYSISENFEPIFDFNSLEKDHVFFYTNYFGLKDRYIESLSKITQNIIIDNAQAFYAKPLQNIDTFYSCRKFFGVPDGAYLFSNQKIQIKLEIDHSYNRFEHLLLRIDRNAEDGYANFVKNDNSLNNLPIRRMSKLTNQLLTTINYDKIAAIRRENFQYLHEVLASVNLLKFKFEKDHVPMVYPFYTNNLELRNKLTQSKIYTAQYWPNVLEWTDENSVEHKFANQIIPLPIDQRLGKKELNKLLKVILP